MGAKGDNWAVRREIVHYFHCVSRKVDGSVENILLPFFTTSRVAATCAWQQPLRGMLGTLSPTLCIRCGEQPHPWKSDCDVVFVR